MSEYIHARELTAGEVLFRHGQQGDDAYIVEDGAIEISVGEGDARKVIATLGPGEILGEMALIANAPRSATATAVQDSVLLVLRRHRLLKPIQRSDPLTQLLLQMMTERLNEASRWMSGDAGRVLQSSIHREALEAVRDMALRRVSTERQLRRGIEGKEFLLHFQPIYRISDGALAGSEALMRWCQPENGFISPAEFIPLAEDTGMIVEMGRWALVSALEEHKRFLEAQPAAARNADPLFVSINISAAQMIESDEAEHLSRAIADSGIDPSSVKLELTESLLVQDPDQAAAALSRLKDTGVQLAIDDFGTGYSSLSYLHRFPFDTLKIDRAFVSRMSQDDSARNLVESIVDMAHRLGMNTIAEGIELEEELDMLGEMGCTAAQGFLLARPVSAGGMMRRVTGAAAGPERQAAKAAMAG